MSMFDGFTSRCTRPARCAASSAEATGGGDGRDTARRQRALPVQQRPGISAGHVAHGDEQHAVRLARREDRHDVRVIDRRGRPRLSGEAPPEFLVTRQRRRENLQRHGPVQPLVARPEHDGHPALADPFLQPVTGDARTCREADHEAAGSSVIISAQHASLLTAWPASRYRQAPITGISCQAE